MRSTILRAAFTFAALVVATSSLPGCEGGGDMEKPGPKATGAPDMNAMPGYKEMQEKMKNKGVKTTAKTETKPEEKPAETPAK